MPATLALQAARWTLCLVVGASLCAFVTYAAIKPGWLEPHAAQPASALLLGGARKVQHRGQQAAFRLYSRSAT